MPFSARSTYHNDYPDAGNGLPCVTTREGNPAMQQSREEIQRQIDDLTAKLQANDREGEGGEREDANLRAEIARLERKLRQHAA